jgi:hypothetical protein
MVGTRMCSLERALNLACWLWLIVTPYGWSLLSADAGQDLNETKQLNYQN